jgi:peptidoglycan/LPS O-acetylase OafA/YrhL
VSCSLNKSAESWRDPAALRVAGPSGQAPVEAAVAAPVLPASPASIAYRPDIDGLRAVAVTLVIAYHVAPQLLPGGFIGVDVFFVISGYLITGLILRSLRGGSFSLVKFYRRRVRRIVPALLVVLVACYAVGWLTLLPGEFRWLGRAILWCAPFLANVHFAHVTGYFDPGADYNLLLHLWSLGVEEQFYLLWPILLIFAVRYAVTASALGAVVAASLAISVWGARYAPVVHFFLPGARAWELAVGAMLAARGLEASRVAAHSAPARRGSQWPTAQHIAVTGLALIVVGALLLSAHDAFPGVWGVIPVGGAALLIAAGAGAPGNRGLLAARPLVFIGRLSYSLYLWHYPMFAFARALWGAALPPAAVAGVIALAFAASYATWRWIEAPVRRGAGGRWTVPALLAGLLAFTALGAATQEGAVSGRLSGPPFAAWETATRDWQIPGEVRFGQDQLEIPALPTRRAATTLFIGDSHMQQYWPRIAQLVAQHPDRARSVLFATYAGCPTLPALNSLRQPRRCDEFFVAATRAAFGAHVDTVVFGAFWELYLLDDYALAGPNGLYRSGDPLRMRLRLESPEMQRAFAEFERVLERLVASGRRVFIVVSSPTSPQFDPRSLVPVRARLSVHVPQSFAADRSLRVDATAFEAFVAPVSDRLRQIAAKAGAAVLDPRSTLCTGMSCPAVGADGMPLYIDSNHLRAAYARERASFLDVTLLEPDPR